MGIVVHGTRSPGIMHHAQASTHRVLSLVLAVAAGLALDALPPESLDPDRELRGELQTGRVACSRQAQTAQHETSQSDSIQRCLEKGSRGFTLDNNNNHS